MNEAIVATMTPVRIVDFHGVRKRGCTAPKKLSGSRPSRAIASSTRGWLSMSTSMTDVMPATAPSEIRNCAQSQAHLLERRGDREPPCRSDRREPCRSARGSPAM